MKKILKITALGFGGGIISLFLLFMGYSYSGIDAEGIIEIPAGAGFNQIALDLKEKGIIENTRFFKLYALFRGDLKNIKPGEYLFKKDSTKKAVLDAIIRGDVRLYKVTIPEGSNIYQIAEILLQDLKIDKTDFLKKAKDENYLKEWKINGKSFEGYLYPETYYFAKGVKVSTIIEKMVKTFHEKFEKNEDELISKGKKLGLSREQIVIFASLVEKETGLPEERKLISAVFHNRLRLGMKLQSDPTTIYGIFERYRGNLTKRDLQEDTPFNTYKIRGLPPGPIANPGMDALLAAVNPSPVTYLYFVSKNDKSHVFSDNLKDHNANVNKYQLHR